MLPAACIVSTKEVMPDCCANVIGVFLPVLCACGQPRAQCSTTAVLSGRRKVDCRQLWRSPAGRPIQVFQ